MQMYSRPDMGRGAMASVQPSSLVCTGVPALRRVAPGSQAPAILGVIITAIIAIFAIAFGSQVSTTEMVARRSAERRRWDRKIAFPQPRESSPAPDLFAPNNIGRRRG
jgi:hypothetical protein